MVRRFRRSPRLILTVATIGLWRNCWSCSACSSRASGARPRSASAVVTFPWHLAWHLAPVVFDANDLVAVIVSVACLAAVWAWFTRSDIGIAVQAAGDRRDRASMLGIPVGRLQSVTWVVAGVLSFVSIFFQATILGPPARPDLWADRARHGAGRAGAGQLQRAARHRGLGRRPGHLAARGGVELPDQPGPRVGRPGRRGVRRHRRAPAAGAPHRPRGRVHPGAGRQRARPPRGSPRPHRGQGRDVRHRRWSPSAPPARCRCGWARASSSAPRCSSCSPSSAAPSSC